MKTFRVICLAGAVFGAVSLADAALDTAKIDAPSQINPFAMAARESVAHKQTEML